MEKIKMPVKKREVTGKRAKKLRRENWVLGNIYGKSIDSLAVMMELPVFQDIYQKAGETALVEIAIEGEKPRSVLIKDVQQDVVNGGFLHVDLYQVDLKEKLTVAVPLEFIGESSLVEQGEGLLLTVLDEVEVECYPQDIPSSIQVDISGLDDFEKVITVGELTVPENVEIKVEPDEVVCKVEPAEMKEEEEPTPVTEEGAAGKEEAKEGDEEATGNEAATQTEEKE